MNTSQKKSSQKGFTLLEMLITVSIIGILAAITSANLGGARTRARDTERVTEVSQIALAVEHYYNACRQYPAMLALTANNGTCPVGVTLDSFITSIPTDPLNNGTFVYVYAVNGTFDDFVIKATLETNSSSLENDVDGTKVSEDCDDPLYCMGG
jgi:general secretion pathway protein G